MANQPAVGGRQTEDVGPSWRTELLGHGHGTATATTTTSVFTQRVSAPKAKRYRVTP